MVPLNIHWFISDTHGFHGNLLLPNHIDTVVHTGDSTNYFEFLNNEIEFKFFIDWFSNLPIKNKILIAGNHDAWATKKYNRDYVKDLGIHYLEHEYLELNGITYFGSPYTPTFGNWYFMKDRSKIARSWEKLEYVDVLLTHGPPKGILDLAYDRNHVLEYCGDSALLKKVLEIKPKIHCFGHIHNNEDCINQGERIFNNIQFINASCVKDNKFGVISSNGVIVHV